jgi:monothiol glutaredoxin
MRHILEESNIHPAIREKVEQKFGDIVTEVRAAVAEHDVVVVGMSQNPHPREARNYLKAAGVPFHYLSYGSYFTQWSQRLRLKMWTGWPTFPMVFVKGVLVGGASDLKKLIDGGDLDL